jgi:hypothetical protein
VSPAQVRLAGLRAAVERDFKEVERQTRRASSLDPTLGEPQAAFVGLALDHAYQALEQVLVAFERALRLPERTGEHWHRALLADAARALPTIRPPLVASERDWEELLSFRHFLRHAYAADLDAARLLKNVAALERAVGATAPLIREALAVLEPDEKA